MWSALSWVKEISPSSSPYVDIPLIVSILEPERPEAARFSVHIFFFPLSPFFLLSLQLPLYNRWDDLFEEK